MLISEFILTKTREPNAKIVNSSLVLSIVKNRRVGNIKMQIR